MWRSKLLSLTSVHINITSSLKLYTKFLTMSDNTENVKRPQFGARYLNDAELVFKHNVWDDVQWDPELLKVAQEKIQKQAEHKIPEEARERFQKETGDRWDKFYNCHQNRFFKDRHWLFTEFPELAGHQKPETPIRIYPSQGTSSDIKNRENLQPGFTKEGVEVDINQDDITSNSVSDVKECKGTCKPSAVEKDLVENQEMTSCENSKKKIFEIGCGVGNTIFPILEYNIDPNIFVYGCDFSKNAIEILKNNPEYNPKRCEAFVCDITQDDWNAPFSKNSLDISTLIFVLSAIHPQKMLHVLNKLYDYMKPGGLVLFRDYGRYDMAQLRFKSGQMMEDNFYVRSDGTFVYFFQQEEVTDLFSQAGFKEEFIYTDRRLQVNRLRQLKMYRVWVQGKYRKPLTPS